jgi:hypothetical protein
MPLPGPAPTIRSNNHGGSLRDRTIPPKNPGEFRHTRWIARTRRMGRRIEEPFLDARDRPQYFPGQVTRRPSSDARVTSERG